MAYSIKPSAGERRAYAVVRLVLVTLLAALAAFAPAIAVHADATITVNTTDEISSAGDSFCTLRDAINNANADLDFTGGDCAAGSGADTITISVNGTIDVASSLPPISTDVTISGPGAANLTVRAKNGDVGVFAVNASGALTLQGVTVANGANAMGAGILNNGGALNVIACVLRDNHASDKGGAIYNSGTLNSSNSTFVNNSASTVSSNSSTGEGGAIYNSGALTVSNSTFDNNSAGADGGGIYDPSSSAFTIISSVFLDNSATHYGGAIYLGYTEGVGSLQNTSASSFIRNHALRGGALYKENHDILAVESSMLSDNTADYGGAIFSAAGDTNILNSTLSGNSATLEGGGIYNVNSFGITDSTLENNSATQNGGGIYSFGYLSIDKSTLSGNSANLGGGIYNLSAPPIINSGSLSAVNTTISGNSASDGGGIYNIASSPGVDFQNVTIAYNIAAIIGFGGGGIYNSGAFGIRNTVIAYNTNNDMNNNCSGADPTDGGHNVRSVGFVNADHSCGSTISSTNCPMLGPLRDNGGPTKSHALLHPPNDVSCDNPLIDSVPQADCPYLIDQRGVIRPQPGFLPRRPTACDIGAFEYSPLPPKAVADTANTAEDTPVPINVLANDSDPNSGDVLAVTGITTALNGTAAVSGTTQVVYTPPLNFNGTDVFTYSVNDGIFTESATITVTVTPVNDTPQISDIGNKSVTAGQSTGPIPFTVSDVDEGDLLSVTASSSNPALVPNANIILGGSAGSRTIRVTPTAGNSGVATITVEVSDDHGGTAQDTFVLTVTAPKSKVYLGFVRR